MRHAEPDSVGIVSTASPEATAAGIQILQSGGNAVDAAVAVSFALGVTEPACSGIGGQSVMIIHPHLGDPRVINGTSYAPRGTPDGIVSYEALHGHRATTIPSTVRVLEHAWRHFGSGALSWPQLLAPAIRYAEEGFIIGSFRHRLLHRSADALRANPSVAGLYLNTDESILPVGTVFRQPVLARTLRRLAEAGAGDFYTGEIAARIAADMAAHSGWLTREDLEHMPAPAVVSAVAGTYRGWDVHTVPPPCGGWTMLLILNILERVPSQELEADSPHRLIWIAEALRLGHTHRRDAPIADLRNYEAAVDIRIDKQTARQLSRSLRPPGTGETTHFSIVDGKGMGVGVTQSINSFFGAKVASPELGFPYNDYMREFELGAPTHPYALRPNGMPYSSMSPTILSRDGEVGLVVGSPGSERIISTVAQVICNWVDADMDLGTAVSAPRLHFVPDDELYVESRQRPASLIHALEQRGFTIVEPESGLREGDLDPYFGGVHAVARQPEGWRGAADPRRDGVWLLQ